MNNGARVQEKIEVEEIKEGVVVLKNQSLKAVLAVSSVNFDLKSSDEQKAIISRFQEFLNSLDFPVQILVVSRKYDISDYLLMLGNQARQQRNELLKIQTNQYLDFVKNLAASINIMSKTFYLVVPFSPLEKIVKGVGEKIMGFFYNTGAAPAVPEFSQAKTQLWQRVEFVASGISSAGLRAVSLNTEELTEFFYKLYNPEAKEKPKIAAENQPK